MSPNPIVPTVAGESSVFARKPIAEFYSDVQSVYLQDTKPWVLGYSGGKDSTATLQIVWTAIAMLPQEKRHKHVYVISSDTYVETPVIVNHIDRNLAAINQAAKDQALPFSANKVVPKLTDTFWVCLLGKGYPAPTTRFRWCTERMKISPADVFILDRVAESGEVVMVLGARKGESASRDQVLKNREIKGSALRKHSSLVNAYVYAPIEEFTTNDVWHYILSASSPWGGDNSELVGMYKNAAGGECPLVVDNSTPSCGNSRFGCWVCPVVDQDHSMKSMVDNGEDWMEPLLEIQKELASHRDPQIKRQIREIKRRDGRVWRAKSKQDRSRDSRNWSKEEGEYIPGPYKIGYRKLLLKKILLAQKLVREHGPDPNACLIREDELKAIRDIWRTESQEWEDSIPKIYNEIFGDTEILWGNEDVTSLRMNDGVLLKEICDTHDVPMHLVVKLVSVERDMQGMAKRAGIFAKIDRIFGEDWKEEREIQRILEMEITEQNEN
jgi:DNA sulfur modification protein DndC